MQEKEKQFKEDIYRYCYANIGKEFLFTGFSHLWPLLTKEEEDARKRPIVPKDLVVITSRIVNDLVKQEIIIEIPKKFENVYGMYKVLSHEKLKND